VTETRSGKYGRFLAQWVNETIAGQPAERQPSYLASFLTELATYSLTPRYAGQSRNEGCVKELEDIDILDLDNPAHLAKLVKEGFHLMYQKDTSRRVLESFNEHVSESETLTNL
jgi:hypothetical protein